MLLDVRFSLVRTFEAVRTDYYYYYYHSVSEHSHNVFELSVIQPFIFSILCESRKKIEKKREEKKKGKRKKRKDLSVTAVEENRTCLST